MNPIRRPIPLVALATLSLVACDEVPEESTGSSDAGSRGEDSTSGGRDIPDAAIMDAGTDALPSLDAGSTDSGVGQDAGVTDAGATDAGATDTGAGFDSGTPDTGTTDAGTTDAGTTDAGTTDAGTADTAPDVPQDTAPDADTGSDADAGPADAADAAPDATDVSDTPDTAVDTGADTDTGPVTAADRITEAAIIICDIVEACEPGTTTGCAEDSRAAAELFTYEYGWLPGCNDAYEAYIRCLPDELSCVSGEIDRDFASCYYEYVNFQYYCSYF